MSRNIIFYSRNCPDSQRLLLLMKNERILHLFQEICIEEQPYVFKYSIRTPVLNIRDAREILVAEAAFDWFYNIRQQLIDYRLLHNSYAPVPGARYDYCNLSIER